jgi:hypothetical protein
LACMIDYSRCGFTNGSNRTPSFCHRFTAGYGVFWIFGSAAIGPLYDLSLPLMIAFFVAAVLAAVPIFIWLAVTQMWLTTCDQYAGRHSYANDNRGADH